MPTVDEMTDFDGGIGPNAMRIRAQGSLVVRGKIPSFVRAELRKAVKIGALGHIKKDGLLPEVFYHPDHKHGAYERRKKEAAYSASLIAGVCA